MKKAFIIDYLGYILLRLFGPLVRSLPPSAALFLGKILGSLVYCFDAKHKAIAYSNIKTAFGAKLPAGEANDLTKDFYRAFGQNLIEIFLIPLIDKQYFNKYITIEGLSYIDAGFKKGKGIIFLAVHAGSWELSNIVCAILGLRFNLFIRQQRYPRLNALLNSYRLQKGCKLIQRQNETRQLIKALKNNEAIGMTADQGGKDGVLVKFFGRDASWASGAIRLALKYNTPIIPVFSLRLSGPYTKIILNAPFEIKKTGDLEKDIRDNLQNLAYVFERYIARHPHEYLWSYKIWKYAKEKKILILSDGKIGHLRQAQAVAKLAEDYLKAKGITAHTDTVEVKYKNEFSRYLFALASYLNGRYRGQRLSWLLKAFLKVDTYEPLISVSPDVVISCGSALTPINFIISRENLAKSILVMRPSILSADRFNLVIMPRHDNPPRRKNIIVTEGALNLIDEGYLNYCKSQVINRLSQKNDQRLAINDKQLTLGLLIGGDTKDFQLREDIILEVIRQIKSVSEKCNAIILATTSRRTAGKIERLIEEEFKNYSACKLLIIANEKNIPQALGGILALSEFIVISPESISMISEAVSSKKYVLVFDSPGLGAKHRRFLRYFAQNKYIYLTNPLSLNKAIEDIRLSRPPIKSLSDNLIITEAIGKIL